MAETFAFDLVSPEKLVFSDNVNDVVVPGADGYFTVYANHAPFVSTLAPGVLTVSAPSGETKIFVEGGFAEINPAGLTVLSEDAVPVSELTGDVLSDRIKEAEAASSEAKDDHARLQADTRLMRLKELA